MNKHDKENIKKSVEKVKNLLPDKDVFEQTIFQQFFNTEVSYDFKRKDLKRINVKNTTFNKCSFEAVAGTGSKFLNAEFSKCDFTGSNFQDCYFNACKFNDKSLIEAANFSNAIFIECVFENVIMKRSTFFNCHLENCKFDSCEIYSDTMESSVFYNCRISNTNLAHLNIEFIQTKNIYLDNVTLPPYQIAYIIGAPGALLNYSGKVDIYTDDGNISCEKYCKLYEDLCIYYSEQKEYFPLANLLIALNKYSTAYEYIKLGIEKSCDYFDFRMVKHFCRLACFSEAFSPKQLKDLYTLITQLSYTNNWDLTILHSYMLHIGAIREILLNSSHNDKQCVEVLIRTNIDKDDLNLINELYNQINVIIREECSAQHIDFIELRHNSPYELLVTCIDSLPSIFAFLSMLYGVLSIGNKFVNIYKNVAEARRISQQNTLYKYQKEQIQLDIELKNIEIQQKLNEMNKPKSSAIYTVTEIEHNIKCSTIDAAKNISPELLHYRYAKSPEN